jgi:hypothetical protein
MDLAIITEALRVNTDPDDFEVWISENERELSNYFYGLSGDSLNALSFDQFYYRVIAASKVYNLYINSGYVSMEFDFFIGLVSVAAEKLAVIGLDSLAQTIVANMPDSASKYRLMALNEFSLVDDVRTDYLTRLPLVLEHLQHSLTLFEDDGFRKVVDVLTYYLTKADKSLGDRGMHGVYQHVQDLFRNEELIEKYAFLNHQILIDILDGRDPFALYPVLIERDRLEPSNEIRTLFGKINSQYFNHPRVFHAQNSLWGYSKTHVLQVVLDRGKCDFTIDYFEITTNDKVLLYCFYNMKKHFFTSYAVFQTVLESLTHFFEIDDYKPVFIDLGCGPMTSGLAIADLINSRTGDPISFSYFGVDIAPPMLAKCHEFKELPIFSDDCHFNFVLNWNDIDSSLLAELAGKNNPIIFNASYLFASRSIDAEELAYYVNNIAQNYTNVYFVFQNPDRTDRNEKYEVFKSYLSYELLITNVEDIRYKAAVSTEGNEEVLYEILKLE